MTNINNPAGGVIQEWIKLRFGLRAFADEMGKNHGTLYNWLKDETVKRKNLIAIIENAIRMGATTEEIKDLLKEIGENPAGYKINIGNTTAKGKNIKIGSTRIVNGGTEGERKALRKELKEKNKKIASLEGQLKAYKEIVDQLTKKQN